VKDATKTVLFFLARHSVSIHASVKDATFDTIDDAGYNFVSIHASVKDATGVDDERSDAPLFQSTRP